MLIKIFNDLKEYRRVAINIRKYKNKELPNPGNYYSLKAFDYYKCIFIHIPRTAGVAISKTLFGNLAGGHMNIRNYQNIYSESTFSKYFKFTIVRNPFTRLYSAFWYLKSGGFDEEDKKWADEKISHINSFEEFVLDWLNPGTLNEKWHFVPQYEFLIDNSGSLRADYTGRFETLSDNFIFIKARLKLPDRILVRQNESRKEINHSYRPLSVPVKEKIKLLYKKDFELFGYNPESSGIE